VLRSSLSASAQINCHISVYSLFTQFVNFDPKTFVFLGYIVSENDPFFVLNSSFIYCQMFRRVVKLWKFLFQNLKQISHLPQPIRIFVRHVRLILVVCEL
jgi:hypothetical protein